MKVEFEVTSAEEADHLRRGLANPVVRAGVMIAGVLSTLPTDDDRVKVLRLVRRALEEQTA